VRTTKENTRVSSLTLVIEDEEVDDLDDVDEDIELNRAFVSALFDEIDGLRMQVRIPYSATSASIYRILPVI